MFISAVHMLHLFLDSVVIRRGAVFFFFFFGTAALTLSSSCLMFSNPDKRLTYSTVAPECEPASLCYAFIWSERLLHFASCSLYKCCSRSTDRRLPHSSPCRSVITHVLILLSITALHVRGEAHECWVIFKRGCGKVKRCWIGKVGRDSRISSQKEGPKPGGWCFWLLWHNL